jgi:5-methyltetrahydropteroyltriglutamate--homocysteine methyltransferase
MGLMTIPTEPIGSIPRPPRLIETIAAAGNHTDPALDLLYEDAIRDTIERFEATGSAVITDGEQRKYHNFWTYCVDGLANTAPDGFRIRCRGVEVERRNSGEQSGERSAGGRLSEAARGRARIIA